MQILTVLSSHLYFLRPGFGSRGILIQDLFETCSAFFGALPVKPEQFPNESRRNLERGPKPRATTPEEIVVNFIVSNQRNVCCSGMCRYCAGLTPIIVRRLFWFSSGPPWVSLCFPEQHPNKVKSNTGTILAQYGSDMQQDPNNGRCQSLNLRWCDIVIALCFCSSLFAKCSQMLRDCSGSSSQICEQLAKDLRTWYGAGAVQARLRPERRPLP
jgi:hypothetical protein